MSDFVLAHSRVQQPSPVRLCVCPGSVTAKTSVAAPHESGFGPLRQILRCNRMSARGAIASVLERAQNLAFGQMYGPAAPLPDQGEAQINDKGPLRSERLARLWSKLVRVTTRATKRSRFGARACPVASFTMKHALLCSSTIQGGGAVTRGTDTVAFIIYVLIRSAEAMRMRS